MLWGAEDREQTPPLTVPPAANPELKSDPERPQGRAYDHQALHEDAEPGDLGLQLAGIRRFVSRHRGTAWLPYFLNVRIPVTGSIPCRFRTAPPRRHDLTDEKHRPDIYARPSRSVTRGELGVALVFHEDGNYPPSASVASSHTQLSRSVLCVRLPDRTRKTVLYSPA